jgi:error-prone DNA polymerase
MRLGLRYVRGLREDAAGALVGERKRLPFRSIADMIERVPQLRLNELQTLAAIGALNSLGESTPGPTQSSDLPLPSASTYVRGKTRFQLRQHRRDALWQLQRAVRRPGPLLEGIIEQESGSPLDPMNAEERLVADFRGTGLTVGPHPMAYRRAQMDRLRVRRAIDLPQLADGKRVRIAGCIIARQRPGTARGFVFLSLEDETGVANAIITPDLFEKNRITLVRERFLILEGKLQNTNNLVSVKADRVMPVNITAAETESHDFR